MNLALKLKNLFTKKSNTECVDICVVSSCGGHLTEVNKLYAAFSRYKHIYIVNDKINLTKEQSQLYHFVTHSERDLKFFLNLFEFYILFKRFRPTVILSTGAGPIVPATMVAKYVFKSEIIYIETITRLNELSLTGKIMYYMADEFYCQWPAQVAKYKKAKLLGPML